LRYFPPPRSVFQDGSKSPKGSFASRQGDFESSQRPTGYFSDFAHATCPISVWNEYFGFREANHGFSVHCQGHLLESSIERRNTSPPSNFRQPLPRSLAATTGISFDFSCLRLLICLSSASYSTPTSTHISRDTQHKTHGNQWGANMSIPTAQNIQVYTTRLFTTPAHLSIPSAYVCIWQTANHEVYNCSVDSRPQDK
jgi:hypothetical protein